MDRSKLVAVVTGAISILLAILYLLVVQLLDFRGEMKPAPVDDFLVVPHGMVMPVDHNLPAVPVLQFGATDGFSLEG